MGTIQGYIIIWVTFSTPINECGILRCLTPYRISTLR